MKWNGEIIFKSDKIINIYLFNKNQLSNIFPIYSQTHFGLTTINSWIVLGTSIILNSLQLLIKNFLLTL